MDAVATGERGVSATSGRAEWPPFPYIYEINTWPWLHERSVSVGRHVDLGSVPEHEWDVIADAGFDAVWLMGLWQRSPAGVGLALANPALVESFRAALPDYEPEDVVGSPYCVRDYTVDERIGGPDGLAAARAALAARGMSLVLDYVPNHVAPDHPWTSQYPERFIEGTFDDLRQDPASFVEVGGRVLANGRDPFFPAWPDVVQLNAFSPSLRAATIETLGAIATMCDGVRCDMAMLMMNDTFERTWGTRAGERPTDDFWPLVTAAVRAAHPGFRFIAETYWDLEWALQQQGFDYCYDKRLYDRLLHESPEAVRLHLMADYAYQAKLLRFVENHDEPRAASLVDSARHKAMAVTTLTQMGARLEHHGQAEGRTTHLPVFLGRFPGEPVDVELVSFYASLHAVLRDPTFRYGQWQLCDRSGWAGNDGYMNLVAWCWDGPRRWLVVVNLSSDRCAGIVRTPWEDLRGVSCQLVDSTSGLALERSGTDLVDGLYVELDAWGWHLFSVDTAWEAR